MEAQRMVEQKFEVDDVVVCLDPLLEQTRPSNTWEFSVWLVEQAHWISHVQLKKRTYEEDVVRWDVSRKKPLTVLAKRQDWHAAKGDTNGKYFRWLPAARTLSPDENRWYIRRSFEGILPVLWCEILYVGSNKKYAEWRREQISLDCGTLIVPVYELVSVDAPFSNFEKQQLLKKGLPAAAASDIKALVEAKTKGSKTEDFLIFCFAVALGYFWFGRLYPDGIALVMLCTCSRKSAKRNILLVLTVMFLCTLLDVIWPNWSTPFGKQVPAEQLLNQ